MLCIIALFLIQNYQRLQRQEEQELSKEGLCFCGRESSNTGYLQDRRPTLMLCGRQYFNMSRLRFITAGESHGKAEVAIIEGMPAGLAITKEDIQKDLARRAHDFGRGGRSKIETDEVEI